MKKRTEVRVCQNYSCIENGAEAVVKKIKQETGLEPGEQNKEIDFDYACCLGCCDFGPNMLVNENLVLGVTPENVMGEIEKNAQKKAKTAAEKSKDLDNVLENMF